MVDVPPAHKFLKKIGITQKVYDKVESIYKPQKKLLMDIKNNTETNGIRNHPQKMTFLLTVR